jgi:electron transfer flavoprotein alpha subunit
LTDDRRVLAVAGWGRDQDRSVATDVISAGRRIAEECGATMCAVIMGSGLAEPAHQIAPYVDETYVIDNPLLSPFQADLHAAALTALCRSLSPAFILLPHDYEAMEVAPKIAYRLGAELVTECQTVELDASGSLLCTKQVYGGNALAGFVVEGAPAIATFRLLEHQVSEPKDPSGKVVTFDCDLDGFAALTTLISTVPESSAGLDAADAIVAGGRGVGTADGLRYLEVLSGALRRHFAKVELGASRPLVDAGLFPRTRQIGQTGERVSPEIYFAVAISGSSQHVSGMIGSRKIVAINKNRDAPIFDIADYGIVGRLDDILPALSAQLEELS